MPLRRLLTAAAGVATVLAVALCAPAISGATTTAGSTASGRPTTGKALLAAALQAADRQKSVHFVAESSLDGRSVQITASTSATAGTQKIVLRSGKTTGHVTGRLVDKIVYFRGDTFGLEEYLGMPTTLAPKYTGKWISFSPSTQDYKGIEKTMTFSAAMGQISLTGPFSTGTSTAYGQAAVTVIGTMTTTNTKGKKVKAKGTLYLPATGTLLPIKFVGKEKQGSKVETGTVVFSQWGLKVAPAAPKGAVAASSITSSG